MPYYGGGYCKPAAVEREVGIHILGGHTARDGSADCVAHTSVHGSEAGHVHFAVAQGADGHAALVVHEVGKDFFVAGGEGSVFHGLSPVSWLVNFLAWLQLYPDILRCQLFFSCFFSLSAKISLISEPSSTSSDHQTARCP